MAPPTTFESNEFKTKNVKFHLLTHFIHMKIGYQIFQFTQSFYAFLMN